MRQDIGLLFMRVSAGAMMLLGHGLDKLLGFNDMVGSFPDPFGLGSAPSLIMAVGAEFFCSVALILGFYTRLVAIPLACTMLTAALIIHTDDPWSKKEFALLYAIPFITLIITGGGRYSLRER